MSTSGADDPDRPIRLDHARVRATTHALDTRVGDMAARRQDVAATVDRLLQVWRGPAAEVFRAHWEVWRDGADAVIEELAAMVDGIQGAHADLAVADTAGGGTSARLLGRLG